MKHYEHLSSEQREAIFFEQPQSFDKHLERETLGYALGATMYMPSYQGIYPKLINKEFTGLTSFAMCFEDAIREEQLERGEENVRNTLRQLGEAVETGLITPSDLPLLFLRVRNEQQFESFLSTLTSNEAEFITGFTFPKFTSENAEQYLQLTKQFSTYFNTPLYGMPILESPSVIYQETRKEELSNIKEVFDRYQEQVLNVRVGGTDFSSLFGLRRGVDYTIYDIRVIADCLSDILNFFMRAEDGYVISAPVWEYFSNHQRLQKPRLRMTPFANKQMLSKGQDIMEKEVDGLIRELILDKANGFVGKTIIHPSHIPYVNAFQTITKEEFEDASMVLCNDGGGVLKSSNGNKMNEMNPHMAWARKIMKKAHVYGVVKERDSIVELF